MFDPGFCVFFVFFGLDGAWKGKGKGKERRPSSEKLLRHKTFPTPSRNAFEKGKVWREKENSHGEKK